MNLTRAFIETPPPENAIGLSKNETIFYSSTIALYILMFTKKINKTYTRSFGASREKLLQVRAVFQFSLQKENKKLGSFESTRVSL